MKRLKQSITMIAIAAVLGAGSFGCNTFKGMGRDIKHGGEGIEKTADKTEDKIQEKKHETRAEKKAREDRERREREKDRSHY